MIERFRLKQRVRKNKVAYEGMKEKKIQVWRKKNEKNNEIGSGNKTVRGGEIVREKNGRKEQKEFSSWDSQKPWQKH